ncbi:MAG: hypothetical protein ACTIJY_08120 [Luteimonas sp.]
MPGRTTPLLVCLLTTLLLSGHARAWPTVPLPEQSQGEWVTRHMNYNGLDMRASRFVTTQSLDDVKAFYRSTWGEQMVENAIGHRTFLGRAEGAHFISVELKSLGTGTEGVVGLMEMVDGEIDFTIGEGFPSPGGSEIYNDIRYLDGPRESRVLALSNERTPFVNHQFYHHQLRMLGWRMTSDGTACRAHSESCLAGFERQSQTMTLVISRGEPGGSHVVATIE